MGVFTIRTAFPTGGSTTYSPIWEPDIHRGGQSGVIQYVHYPATSALSVEGVSLANPAVVTITGHGLKTGDLVSTTGLTDPATADNLTDNAITVIDEDSFSLDGINTGADLPWSSGGTVTMSTGSVTTSIEGSMDGTTWVEVVSGTLNPTAIYNFSLMRFLRLKQIITAGNRDDYRGLAYDVGGS